MTNEERLRLHLLRAALALDEELAWDPEWAEQVRGIEDSIEDELNYEARIDRYVSQGLLETEDAL